MSHKRTHTNAHICLSCLIKAPLHYRNVQTPATVHENCTHWSSRESHPFFCEVTKYSSLMAYPSHPLQISAYLIIVCLSFKSHLPPSPHSCPQRWTPQTCFSNLLLRPHAHPLASPNHTKHVHIS